MLRRISSFLAILTVLACAPGWSQDTRGTINGRVTDPSGAVIPGASVLVTNVAMGTKAAIKTNQDGYYQAALLMPGMYHLEVTVHPMRDALRPRDGLAP